MLFVAGALGLNITQLIPARDQASDDFSLDSGAFYCRLVTEELESLVCYALKGRQ